MIIFRNDDISPNTDFDQVHEIYSLIKSKVPDCQIWSCVNLFSMYSMDGALYPDLPLSPKPMSYFYNVDQVWNRSIDGLEKIVSHGILHNDHTKFGRDAKELSILTSCKFLKTNIFVPPFSRYDADMDTICKNNDIHMSKREDGWKSLESEPFNSKHNLWFFHSWRFTPETFKEVFI